MPEVMSQHSPRWDEAPAMVRRRILGVTIVGLGLVASGIGFLIMRRVEASRLQSEFEQQAHRAAQLVADGLQRHQDTLYALRAFFHFAPEVTRASFSGVARELIQRQTGVRALEWIERVPGAERARFEARQRAEGMADFAFRERVSGNTLRPAPIRPEYFPVVFIEPLAGNEPALGFDLQSGTTWPTMERIAGTDELAASGRLPLLSINGESDWGYLMELPVYRQPVAGAAPESRRERLRGYVMGIFHIAQTIESFFASQEEDVLEILFIDRSAPRPELEFLHFRSRDGQAATAAAAPTVEAIRTGLHLRVPINHAGRHWELWFRPRAGWVAERSQMRSWLVLALGVAVTGFAGAYVFGALRREQLVGQQVADRTAELRAAQAELEQDNQRRREAERQLNHFISHLPGAAFRSHCDVKMSALFASDGMLPLTGYTADDFVSGRVSIGELTLAGDRFRAARAIIAGVRQHAAFEFEARIRARDGTPRWLLVRGRPVFADDGALRFLEGLATDVTALKAAEAEKLAIERKLLEAQRLESLGVLAGGIAHDFNNLLTAMLGNAVLARDLVREGDRVGEHLGHIEQAARRAADLCQQMLAYAGRKELRLRPVDLSELVRSTTTLLRVSIRRNTRLELRLGDQLPAVHADPAQIQQIVMNLVINAAEAIGEQTGEIRVTTSLRQVDAADLRTALRHPELPTGSYVALEVSDTGCGMSPETVARIFEPFFTTKFSGRGLGLAAVLGIVQSHRGALFVESVPGRGSVFRLLLQALSLPAPPAPVVADAGAVLRGNVLVVDDEEAVREVLAAVLRRLGLTPFTAASGDEALRIFAEQGDRLKLVLLDLTMPGLSGEETLRALRSRNRGQPVILMSGFSAPETVERCAGLGVSGFLAKPFEMEDLSRQLRALAD